MERRSRSWALGLSIIGFFALLFSAGFVQQVKADDVSEYGTVIGIFYTNDGVVDFSNHPAAAALVFGAAASTCDTVSTLTDRQCGVCGSKSRLGKQEAN
ncbi:ATPase with role in protein import into the ER [Podospora pseudopauciseta]|uniref:ATPase with role in protein import into the ER n=1 Tax=Podospora pseudopauciseta TaxID=2093780 RepID=A0ABR0HDK6_9PEZI|nr:ATPase with role in protein import into the ER [Podospora pseudopauciseta]